MSKFCVIAKSVSDTNIPRHWKDTEEEACEHAGEILQRYCDKGKKLIVVQAVKIVERQYEYNVRDLKDSDLK